jgi:hypothetical protein
VPAADTDHLRRVQAMAERALTLARQPKILKAVKAFDVLLFHGKHYEDCVRTTRRERQGQSRVRTPQVSLAVVVGLIGDSVGELPGYMRRLSMIWAQPAR